MPRCELCGGEYEDGVCMYCGNKTPNKITEKLQNLIKPFSQINQFYENIRKKCIWVLNLNQMKIRLFIFY